MKAEKNTEKKEKKVSKAADKKEDKKTPKAADRKPDKKSSDAADKKKNGKNGKPDLKDLKGLADHAADTISDAADSAKEGLEKLDFTSLFHQADKLTPDGDTRSQLFQKICGLIPGKVSNSTILSAFELMRKQQRILKKDFSANLKKNKAAFDKHTDSIKKNNGFIEDQNQWTDTAYGDSTMQYSGCEIFATFNAIRSIPGKSLLSIPELISEFEKDGIVLSGKFGTAPKAISDLLEKHGFRTEVCTDEKDFDSVGKRSESLILTMYNDKNDISQEVHTINISKKDEKYTAHNTYCNGRVLGPFGSVSETIRNINSGKAKGISLIGIKKK